jgi:ribosomal protein S18 acetylase RimI-like enzyme
LDGGIEVVPARASDLDTVLSILKEAARWLACREIEGWQPGSYCRRRIADRRVRGEMYLARLAGQTFGTFALQWSDEEVWGDAPEDAGYVHGMAIRRGFAGLRLGRELLRWAEERPVQSRKKYLRFDFLAENWGSNEYYERAGFRRRGLAGVSGLEVRLYEKRVGVVGAGNNGSPAILFRQCFWIR